MADVHTTTNKLLDIAGIVYGGIYLSPPLDEYCVLDTVDNTRPLKNHLFVLLLMLC